MKPIEILLQNMIVLYPKHLLFEFQKVFGAEAVEKLLLIFSGTTIKVPSREEVEELLRDVSIFNTLKDVRSKKKYRKLRLTLEVKFGLKGNKVDETFKRVKKAARSARRFQQRQKRISQHRRVR